MFERYTEKARRVIFFARYEASQFGQPYIETEHLLLGILREDKALTNRFLRTHSSVQAIRNQIQAHTAIVEKTSTSVDLPLSNECKRILAYAAEEAERLNNKHIGVEHLLLGLLREERGFAAQLLTERGVKLAAVRDELANNPPEVASRSVSQPAQPGEFLRDLTQAAMEGQLDPVVEREQEINALIEVLSTRHKRSPLLVGERGVGKTAIVELLAQRIADSEAPSCLADKRILAYGSPIAPNRPAAGERTGEQLQQAVEALTRPRSLERLNSVLQALMDSGNAIVFLGELQSLWSPVSTAAMLEAGKVLKYALLRGQIQFIATSTTSDYVESVKANPWLAHCFRPVHVRPMDEAATLHVLEARKAPFEKFHGVTYTGEAVELVAQSGARYLPDLPLPGKALELLDVAGMQVKLRQSALPEAVLEVMKRLRFIDHRMEFAIANHEFEKARFYSDEERKERENLSALRERLHLDESTSGTVTRDDVEAAIARWSAYPFRPDV
jgi:ATP-dependent Clp protease ATP-binding subunit ClpC